MAVANIILALSLLFVAVDCGFFSGTGETVGQPEFSLFYQAVVKKRMGNDDEMIHEMESMREMMNEMMMNENKVAKEIKPKVSFGAKVLQVNGFSWSLCSKKGDPTTLTSLSLKPDPLRLPGNVSVAVSGQLKVDLNSPLSLDVSVKKKMLFWIDLPCVDNIGSCSYDDICQLLSTIQCPPEFPKYGIPCKCPIKAKTYTLPATNFYVNPVGVPSWMQSGQYEAIARLSQSNKEITCIKIKFSVK